MLLWLWLLLLLCTVVVIIVTFEEAGLLRLLLDWDLLSDLAVPNYGLLAAVRANKGRLSRRETQDHLVRLVVLSECLLDLWCALEVPVAQNLADILQHFVELSYRGALDEVLANLYRRHPL